MKKRQAKPQYKKWEDTIRYLSEDEITEVISANYQAMQIAYDTGKRTPIIDWIVVNLCLWGLRISEIKYLEIGQVYLPPSKGDRGCLNLKKTKGDRPRDVYIGPFFTESLRTYLVWKESVGEPIDPNAPVVYSRQAKGPMSISGLRKAFKRAIRRGQVYRAKLTPHTGRHTLASHMVPQGYLVEVKQALGHSSIAVTNIYTHLKDYPESDLPDQYEIILYSKLPLPKDCPDKTDNPDSEK